MSEIQIFKNPQFGEIRTAGTSDNPLFCLSDLCKCLGLSAKGVNQRLRKEVISNYPLQTAGGIQQALFVNEDGLYDVILDSRKPEARAFRKWVTGEVLPSIRKTGSYTPDDYYIDTSNVTRKDLAAVILESEEDLKAQDKIIEEQKVQIKELKEKLEQVQKEKIEKRFEKVENAIIRLAELMATSRIQPPIPVKKPETGLPLFPNEKPQPREIANGKIRPSIAKPLHPGTYLVSEVRFTMMNESGINLRSRDIFRWLRREGWVSSENTSYNKPSPMAIKNGWMLPAIGNGRRITDKMHFTPRFTESGYRKFVETIMKKGGLL